MSRFIESFTTTADETLVEDFLKQGYVIRDVDSPEMLRNLRHAVVEVVCEHLRIELPADENEFLNNTHKKVPLAALNNLRVTVFNRLNSFSWFRPTYYGLAKSTLEALVGNELAMQNKVNFSVQCPNDESSVLSVHADVWTEESPFQVVHWLPLVDVYDTKSMYILDPEANRTVNKLLARVSGQGGSERLFEEFRDKFKWLKIPFGKVLIFSPILLHGNVVNEVPETRWSLNCRFKGLFTPYPGATKKLGDFYLPITTRVVSRVGMNYQSPAVSQ